MGKAKGGGRGGERVGRREDGEGSSPGGGMRGWRMEEEEEGKGTVGGGWGRTEIGRAHV